MPAYSYTALDISGIKKKGVLSAQSERDARKLIKELNLTPMTCLLYTSDAADE